MSQKPELPRYKCHKIVSAIKIASVVKHAHPDPGYDDATFEASDEFKGAHLMPEDKEYPPIPVDAAFYRKHNPDGGMYYVVYEDGYASMSPAAAFESGYAMIENIRSGDAMADVIGTLKECARSLMNLQQAGDPAKQKRIHTAHQMVSQTIRALSTIDQG